jgi:hypothetical protein
VAGNKVEQVYFVAFLCKPERIGSGSSTDVQDNGTLWAQVSRYDLFGTFVFEPTDINIKPVVSVADSRVVIDKILGHRWRPFHRSP